MTRQPPTNPAASIRARLLSLSKSRGEDFTLTLLNYGIERFLYRLSRSTRRDQFVLKGAVLFDPVAADGFSANLKAISAGGSRPVLSVAARPSVINLSNNSFGALKDLSNTFVGVQLVWSGFFLGVPYGGSCHTMGPSFSRSSATPLSRKFTTLSAPSLKALR